MKVKIVFILLFLLLVVSSCERKKVFFRDSNTFVGDSLIMETKYAVIKPDFVRIKENPDITSTGISTFYRDDIIPVFLMINQLGGWCQVISQDINGWILIDDLVLFDSLTAAKTFQSDLGRLSKSESY